MVRRREGGGESKLQNASGHLSDFVLEDFEAGFPVGVVSVILGIVPHILVHSIDVFGRKKIAYITG
jgi:hypothetical protein